MNGQLLSSPESSNDSRKQYFGYAGSSSGSDKQLINTEPAQIKDFNLFDEFLSPPIPHPLDGIGTKQALLHNMETLAKKRKSSYDVGTFDRLDDDGGSMDSTDNRKFARPSFESQSSNDRQNHSEIEKRRRDKMNAYITELSSMLPMCNAMNRKLDKLTVLRMAVQHIKSLRGAATTYTEASHRPSFLSEDELKHLILEAAEGFLFVVSCDRARILYVSESVRNVLCYSRNDLIGQSLLDYLHPKDINKVKEQLSSSDLAPRERLIDAKTMMPVKTELPQRPTHLSSGSRRSFFCRMKRGSKLSDISGIKMEKYSDLDLCNRKKKFDRKSFIVIHCTGYLKSWPMSKMDVNEQDDNDDNCNLSCLVAIGQVKLSSDQRNIISDTESINLRPVEYTSRHSIDGKFTYIDQGAMVLLGYLPQEILGTSVYEYYHQDDITEMAEVHRKVLKTKEKFKTNVYRFKSKDGSFIHLRSICFSFRNPWTKEVEYIVSKNTVVPVQEVSSSGQSVDAGGVTLELNEDSIDDADTSKISSSDTSSSSSPNNSYTSATKTFGISPFACHIHVCLQNDKFACTEDRRSDVDSCSKHLKKEQTAESRQLEKRLQIPGLPGGTRPGAGRIGRQIADEILELQKNQESPHAVADSTNHTSSPDQAKILLGRASIPSATTSCPTASTSTSRSTGAPNGGILPTNRNGISVHVPAASGSAPTTDTNLIENVMAEQNVIEEMNVSGNDGNDEAAMSIIMSLLEADAGLGGPIDFNDLPWPL